MAIRRGDLHSKKIAIVFTGDQFAEGGEFIATEFRKQKLQASFFLTGRFYSNPSFAKIISQLKKDGHYLGAHSDQHLLYNDWAKRDSLLVTKDSFLTDLHSNYRKLRKFGVKKTDAPFFLPPFEWYNDSIIRWTKDAGLRLINYSPGTLSHADYTLDAEKAFRSSDQIWKSIIDYEAKDPNGLNGFILLMHIGAGPERTDKFYLKLPELLNWLHKKGYQPVRIDEMLK